MNDGIEIMRFPVDSSWYIWRAKLLEYWNFFDVKSLPKEGKQAQLVTHTHDYGNNKLD